jgi:hypothetical protein
VNFQNAEFRRDFPLDWSHQSLRCAFGILLRQGAGQNSRGNAGAAQYSEYGVHVPGKTLASHKVLPFGFIQHRYQLLVSASFEDNNWTSYQSRMV